MLINGNALHIPLADKSVQCIVTSPPYWGLRDYGTAEWVGGDAGCDHSTPRSRGDDIKEGDKQGTSIGSRPNTIMYCSCGAIRIDAQLGLEQTPEEYVENVVAVFREVWRVLCDDGTLWLNLGDSYAGNMSRASSGGRAGYGTPREGVFNRGGKGLKDKDLVGIPWRVAFALQANGWYLRNDIIWHKPNPMPESVKDRCTKSHEYIFLLTKNKKYYYNADAIREPGKYNTEERKARAKSNHKSAPTDKHSGIRQKIPSGWDTGKDSHSTIHREGREQTSTYTTTEANTKNKRTVWTITPKPYKGAHYATFPPELPEVCIKAGSAKGDIVLDPFAGSGTTVMVARDLGRQGIGLDLSLDYLINNARKRLELDKLEYWINRGEEVENNFDGLPMFSDESEKKDHKNMHRKDPHSFHKATLEKK